ncbi:MAG: DUF1559 domain-containing protein [Planctomycetota bacterium]|nr:DUF1559 domain-containing protein [Planctomycetota bacterium]
MVDQDNPYIANDDANPTAATISSSSKKGCGGTLLATFAIVGSLIVVVGLILPMSRRGSSSEAARRMYCSSNLRQIGIGLLNYEFAYKTLPPAYTVDENGKRLHSWRALILPFIEQQKLHEEIDFAKPWNHPDNKAIADLAAPSVFRCPSSPIDKKFTTFLGIVDTNTCLQETTGRVIADVTDGPSETLMVVEANPADARHWMEPSDLDLKGFLASFVNEESAHYRGRHAITLDNSVRFLPVESKIEVIEAAVTPNSNDGSVELPGA